ncbi:MAG: S4 domain-containing protein [archaeon]
MSNKGESKQTKSRSMPKQIHVSKKETYWIIHTKSGPHSKSTSMPLGLIVRNFAKIATTLREAKSVLNHGEIKVNGVIRKDHQFPVGLFDVVSVEKQKLFFRVLLDDKERLILKTIEKESKEKVSKVTKKIMTSKGIQLTTNDGRTYFGIKADVEDSLKIKLPEGKVEETIKFEEGAVAYVTKGAHASETATVKGIVSGTARRKELVKLANKDEEFETIAENVFVIGKGKSAMAEM